MKPALPPLNWLRVFEAAARYQSFARAAGELNMSAAAVSQQIRALETHLGHALFDRHAHAVTLTRIGQAYLPSVQQSLISLHAATEGIFGTDTQQSCVVQALPLFAHGVIGQGYGAFAKDNPQITFTLNTEQAGPDHTGQYHDLRVEFGALPGGAQIDPLLGEQLFPVAIPEIAATISEPADLLQYPLIDVAAHRAGWPYLFEHLGYATHAARYVQTDNTVMACALAAGGAGIALARAPASDAAVAMAGLRPCLDGFRVDGAHRYYLVTPDHLPLRKPARQFRDWLLSYCGGLSAPG